MLPILVGCRTQPPDFWWARTFAVISGAAVPTARARPCAGVKGEERERPLTPATRSEGALRFENSGVSHQASHSAIVSPDVVRQIGENAAAEDNRSKVVNANKLVSLPTISRAVSRMLSTRASVVVTVSTR